MKKLVGFLFLCLPLVTWGLPHLPARGFKPVSSTFVTGRGIFTPKQAMQARQHTQAAQRFARMERMVHTQLVSSPQARQSILTSKLSQVADQQQYTRVMQNLQHFKQQADPLLYYQAKSGERHTLSTAEVRYWIERVYTMQQDLNSLRTSGISTDQSLAQAYEYLNYVLQTVAPSTTPLTVPDTSLAVEGRVYDPKEFFLHDPMANTRWNRALGYLGIKHSAKGVVPPNLEVVVFNDMDYVLENMKSWQQQGMLLPTTKIHFFDNAEAVRQHIIRLGNHPQLVLTDLNTSNGLEGLALAQDLRQNGYKGILLAFSGYAEETLNGPVLLQAGIDGTISRDGKKDDFLRQHILKSIQNYYYYQQLHQWSR